MRQDCHNACKVETGLTGRFTTAKQEILDCVRIKLGYLREYSTHNSGSEVIGSALDQRSLGDPANGATGGSYNDSFGHLLSFSFSLKIISWYSGNVVHCL